MFLVGLAAPSRAACGGWLSLGFVLMACPRPPPAIDPPDAGSHEAGDAGPCPQTPCVAGAECVAGVCYSRECGAAVCPPGELCFGSRCVSASCAGVRCPFGECVDGRCPSCSVAQFSEVDGGCAPKRTAGEPCDGGHQCVLSHCIEGICCERSCDGPCDRCVTGRCTSRPAGDPGALGSECFPGRCPGGSSECGNRCFTDSSCADGGACFTGFCEARRGLGDPCARGGECVSGHCVAGNCCDDACASGCGQCRLADGGSTAGECRPLDRGAQSTCAPYRCDGIDERCPTTCVLDTDCSPATFCNAQGRCVPVLGPPAACTRSSQCASGRCNNGVCCQTGCLDGCQTCEADAGCASLPDGPADAGGALCAANQPYCSRGHCCSAACTEDCGTCATGACVPDPYRICGGTTYCRAGSLSCPGCSVHEDCAPEFYCSAGMCIPMPPCCVQPIGGQCCDCNTFSCYAPLPGDPCMICL